MRLALSLIGGFVAATALFFLMDSLVSGQSGLINKGESPVLVDFIRKDDQQQVQRKERRKPKIPPKPLKRPPPPQLAVAKQDKPPPQPLNLQAPSITVPVTSGGGPYLGRWSADNPAADGDVIPIVRIAPQYPRAARMRGTEGWVKVRFTINEDGTVSNPEVIEAEPARVFNREAMRAILRWKFKPRIVNGVATTRRVTQVITFDMSED